LHNLAHFSIGKLVNHSLLRLSIGYRFIFSLKKFPAADASTQESTDYKVNQSLCQDEESALTSLIQTLLEDGGKSDKPKSDRK
jgi:hypothetical protein